jgi:hypothetical protein
METLLAGVTLASLGLAAVMSLVAWRLIRAEKQRAAARVEALEALAFRSSGDVSSFVDDEEDGRADLPVNIGAPAAAHDWDAALGGADARETEERELGAGRIRDAGAVMPDHLFDEPRSASLGPAGRRWLTLATLGLTALAAWAVSSALRSPEVAAAVAASRTGNGIVILSAGTPLELLSLRHGSSSNGDFTVTGLVQNPTDGLDRNQVEAVVYLFDEQGRYFASGHAPLETPRLARGDESPFVVAIPNVSGVSRYRVAFREPGGGSIAHVDRRGQTPMGTTAGTLVDDLPLARPAVAPRPAPGTLAP